MTESKPQYELSSYDPVEITVAPFVVDDQLVDNEIERMTSNFTQYLPVETVEDGYQLKAGDFAKVAIKAWENGSEMKGLTTDGRTYAVGSGEMPEGFENNVIGMKIGETKTFSFEGPSWDEDYNPCTSEVKAEVTVLELQREVKPTIDDAWVKANMPAYKSAENMRDSIRKNIEDQARPSYESYLRQAAANALIDRFEGKIADEDYEKMMAQVQASMQMDLQSQGKSWEQFVEENGGEGQVRMFLLMQARDLIAQGYVLDAIYRHFNLQATDEDYELACRQMNPMADPKALRKQIEESRHGDVLKELAERTKANQYIVDNAIISYK